MLEFVHNNIKKKGHSILHDDGHSEPCSGFSGCVGWFFGKKPLSEAGNIFFLISCTSIGIKVVFD
jgi:hypothetical protein